MVEPVGRCAVTCLAAWIAAGALIVLLWSWWRERTRSRDDEPDQWSRYRGVMELRERAEESPPIDTAHLTLFLRRNGRVSLAEPLACGKCRRATMIVHRGDDGGVRCPTC